MMANSENKICQNCKQNFTIEPEDFIFYDRIKVPPPTWCPECRATRRLIWRNEKAMHRKKCDATGKVVFSHISATSPFKVYDRDYWWSDAWNPMEYGREIDFSRPFLEQLKELMLDVPWFSRSVVNNVESEYCMGASDLKNCYLVFHASNDESCYYTVGAIDSKDSFDNSFIDRCELCHQCVFCTNCYQVFYCVDCENSQGLYFCKDCKNCQDCIGCAGLRNKQYYIFNQPFSKEDYDKELGLIKSKSRTEFLGMFKKSREIWMNTPVKYVHENKNSFFSGEYVYNSKNVLQSYIVKNSENLKFCQNIFLDPGAKDCYDYSFFGKESELMYEASSCGINDANIKFSVFIYPNSQRVSYSAMCPSSQDLFGCVGLKSKQYCILNKQYTRNEYEELIPKIIDHMNKMSYIDKKGREYRYGEFFPPEFCPFGYNETIAQEYFPKTRKEAENGGWSWILPDIKEYEPTLSWKDLPEKVSHVDENITKEVVLCESWDKEGPEKALEHNCSKAFRIIPEEFRFYKQFNLPLPTRCFNSRHHERVKTRNPVKLWHRQCMCDKTHPHHSGRCPNKFETSYAPERPEIVYCEACYNAEVV